MKILYIIHQFYPHYSGGTEKVALNISSMMQQAGHKVKIIAYRPEPSEKPEGICGNVIYNEYFYQKVPVLEFYLQNEPIDLNISLHNEDILNFAKSIIEKEKPDLIHLFHPMRVCSFLAAADLMKVPYIVTVTDLMFICPKIIMRTTFGDLCDSAERGKRCNTICCDTGSYNDKRFNLSEDYLEKASALITPSNFIKNMIKKECHGLNIRVIHHGMVFDSVKRDNKVYKKESQLTIGFIGTVQEHKGTHLIIDAIMNLRNTNIKCKIYGDNSNTYAKKLIQKTAKDPRIEFCGTFQSNEIEKIYEGLDVIVIPSICYESYSLVKHEAIIRNIPVIVSDVGALTEMIEAGVNSYIFDPDKKNALLNLIEHILKNTEELNNIKVNLSRLVVNTIEQESFQYLSIYKSCIGILK